MAHICSCAYGGVALTPIMQSLKLIYIVSLIIFWYPSISVAGKARSSTLFVSAEDMP